MSENHPADIRRRELTAWIRSQPDLSDARIEPASDDASFRRYFRVTREQVTWIAMDAPPPQENCQPFVAIAGYLRDAGLSAPAILASDIERGFLLMSDFGDKTYLQLLDQTPSTAGHLYRDALDALLTLQRNGAAVRESLPPYDDALLSQEMSLFRDWLCGTHLGLSLSAQELADWDNVTELLVASALEQPRVFVHRDYHSRNLMVLAEGNPGIIDFQDAMNGPLTYDLVSLLRDCYWRLAPEDIDHWCDYFYSRSPAELCETTDAQSFRRWFDLMGVQRHLKAAGIFARLKHRDGKPGYLGDIPQTLDYVIDVAARYGELAPLATLISERCLPALESIPCRP